VEITDTRDWSVRSVGSVDGRAGPLHGLGQERPQLSQQFGVTVEQLALGLSAVPTAGLAGVANGGWVGILELWACILGQTG
jgi:hypothetical protein